MSYILVLKTVSLVSYSLVSFHANRAIIILILGISIAICVLNMLGSKSSLSTDRQFELISSSTDVSIYILLLSHGHDSENPGMHKNFPKSQNGSLEGIHHNVFNNLLLSHRVHSVGSQEDNAYSTPGRNI